MEEARKFISEVSKIAKKYNANYFIVTDGASGTYTKNITDKDNPIIMARKNQIEWEKKHGFDPDEDWSSGEEDLILSSDEWDEIFK